ncbi:hypothetical protein SUGI_0306440 [Cryptomeria japonica]|nr:hypothetical protein SUGI_0306440 [Cryptomeria japonica]
MDSKTLKTPRVCSVDDYRVNECKIIILSLVRSNKAIGVGGSKGIIGFLKVSECVRLCQSQNGATHLWKRRGALYGNKLFRNRGVPNPLDLFFHWLVKTIPKHKQKFHNLKFSG